MPWEIRQETNIISEGVSAWGLTSVSKHSITLDPSIRTENLLSAYGHELIHVFLTRLGIHNDDLEKLEIRTVGQLCDAFGEFFMELVLGCGSIEGADPEDGRK
jgi:hypothetical protein